MLIVMSTVAILESVITNMMVDDNYIDVVDYSDDESDSDKYKGELYRPLVKVEAEEHGCKTEYSNNPDVLLSL